MGTLQDQLWSFECMAVWWSLSVAVDWCSGLSSLPSWRGWATRCSWSSLLPMQRGGICSWAEWDSCAPAGARGTVQHAAPWAEKAELQSTCDSFFFSPLRVHSFAAFCSPFLLLSYFLPVDYTLGLKGPLFLESILNSENSLMVWIWGLLERKKKMYWLVRIRNRSISNRREPNNINLMLVKLLVCYPLRCTVKLSVPLRHQPRFTELQLSQAALQPLSSACSVSLPACICLHRSSWQRNWTPLLLNCSFLRLSVGVF